MYNTDTILESWKGLIGWRQNYDPNGKQLEEELTQSESGLYFQDTHPMLTLQNLESIMPDYNLVNFPTWDNTKAYAENEIVKLDGVKYKAITASTGLTPADNPQAWKLFNPFSEWLAQKTRAAQLSLITNFIEKKEILGQAKAILESRSLFDGIGRLKDTIPKRQRRAGFEIVNSRSKGITAKIERVGLQFTENGSITIQLHHSSQKTPLKELICAYNKAKSVQWFDVNWFLPHISENTDSGGAYYITYVENNVAGEAIYKERQWNEAPCEECVAKSELNTWKLYSPFIEFHPFTVPNADAPELWDIEDNLYNHSRNFGLNFQISMYCDHTPLFTEQKDLFKNAILQQTAVNLLRELAYNPNSIINRKESTADRAQLLYEIDGDTRGRKTGKAYEYEKALKAISLNTRGLNKVCLPCNNRGIKFKAI